MSAPVFPAVEPESPVYEGLERLREVVAGDPGLDVTGDASIRAELRARRRSSGEVELTRFYWSVRRTTPDAPLGFSARTLYYHRRVGTPEVYDFPDEPVMDWLPRPDGPLYSHPAPASVAILRYIPLRRVTFLLRDAPGLPVRVIAKTKRRSSLLRATRALLAARRAAARGGGNGFAIPRPVRLDTARGLLYLAELPGRPVSEVLDQLSVTDAMRQVGRIHRELHELPVTGVGTRTTGDWLAAVADAAAQLTVLVPSVAAPVTALHDELVRTAPEDGERGFCQGDFVPSQILWDPSGWAVLDLDDGHLSDPHAEVAALYTALPRELSLPAGARTEEVRQAYLDGYTERAGRPLAPDRWRWFVTVAELRYLTRRVVKGRALPGEAPAAVDDLIAGRTSAPDR